MPIKGYRCDATKQPVHFDDCINCADSGRALKNHGCYHSADVLRGIVANIKPQFGGFTVTELLDCPRALWLKRRHDFQVFPSRAFWAFRGQLFHKIFEDSIQPGDIAEKRMTIEVEGITLSGQPDLIRGDAIFDYKSVKSCPKQVLEHHTAQVSMYRWLASKATGLAINRGFLVYLSMSEHSTLPCEMWSLPDTEKFVKEKLKALAEAMPKDFAPSFEDNFDPKNWKCGREAQYSYCDVRGHCTEGQVVTTAPAPEYKKARKVVSSKA